MTQDAATRPPRPRARGKKLVYVAVPDEGWRVAGDGTRCRYRRGGSETACHEEAVAEKYLGDGPVYPWWGYCRDHAARRLHWAEDGRVMTWDLRRAGREDVPLTVAEAARVTGGSSGMCAAHHCPRSECPPESSHGHSIRFREDLWEAAERIAEDDRAEVAIWVRQAMEARLGYLRCPRCRETAPPVPLEFGDLSGRPLGEWITEAASEVKDQHPWHEPVQVGADTPSAPAAIGDIPFRSPAVTR